MKRIIITLLCIICLIEVCNAQFFKKLQEKVNNETNNEVAEDIQGKEHGVGEVSPCSKDAVESAMKKYYKSYGYDELERCEKWHVNKPTEDVYKFFESYTYKKGFTKEIEIYLGPKFYGQEPQGTQDRYGACYYNGLINSRVGTTLYFSNSFVFNTFWLDTAKRHIVPLRWNIPAGYVPPKFLGTKQGTVHEWRNELIAQCYNPDDPIMRHIYQLYFLPYEEYHNARLEMAKQANIEVQNYQMTTLCDAQYYNYYYGPRGKAHVKYSDDVIGRNASKWAVDSLDKFIDIFTYAICFNDMAGKVIENKISTDDIVAALIKYPKAKFNKGIVEGKLVQSCSTLHQISMIKHVPNFSQLKELEAKAYDLAINNKNIDEYETYLMIYPSGVNTDKVKKLRDAELARLENERITRMAKEGPGGIWYIKGPRIGSFLWVVEYNWTITYLDKTSADISCEYFPQVSLGGANFKSPHERETYFRMKNKMFYKYNNISNAAKALYQIMRDENALPKEGLLEVRDETPPPVQPNSNDDFSIAKTKDARCNVKRSPSNYSASISIYSGGLFGSKVDKDLYFVSVTNKYNKNVFASTDVYKDNGFDSPYVNENDLPCKVVIQYRKSKSDPFEQVEIKIKNTGIYSIDLE